MHQVLINDPAHGLYLRTNPVLLFVAVVVCSWHGARCLRRIDGLDWHRARWGFLILAIVPWIGGHLHFLMNNWDVARARPERLFLPWMGLHAGGVMIALAVATPLVVRSYSLPLGRIADALIPTIGIGIVIGRLGCLAEGCCFGRVCHWPWCISFPKGPYIYEFHLSQGLIEPGALWSAPVHPLQLYFAAVGVLLVLLGHWLHPRRRYDGEVALVALVVFSVTAALLELLRADYYPRVYWGPLPQLLWTALGMTLLSAVGLALCEWRHTRSEREDAGVARGGG